MQGIDWSLQPERRAALIGPNGAGKTTLCRIITGELQQDSGEIGVEGVTVTLGGDANDYGNDIAVDTAGSSDDRCCRLSRAGSGRC